MNEPSPDVNPANQFGSIVDGVVTSGLSTGTTSGNSAFSFSDKPKFIDALIATVLPG